MRNVVFCEMRSPPPFRRRRRRCLSVTPQVNEFCMTMATAQRSDRIALVANIDTEDLSADAESATVSSNDYKLKRPSPTEIVPSSGCGSWKQNRRWNMHEVGASAARRFVLFRYGLRFH